MSTDLKTCFIAIVDLGVVALLAGRVTPVRFRQLKWSLAGAAAIFWGVLAAALIWGYWDIYYRYFYPEWVGSLAPVSGVNYAVFGLLLWWIASRLPGHPTINFCLLGGLESVPEHLWGIYGARILERVPVFQGERALSILAFAFFEYILYWSIVLSLAVLLRRVWELWRRRGQKQVNIL
jgi:hypothetical protein